MKTHSKRTRRASGVSVVLAVATLGATRLGFAESAATKPSAQTQPAPTVVAQASANNGPGSSANPSAPPTGSVNPATTQPISGQPLSTQPLSRPADVSKEQIEEALRRARASTQRKADLAADQPTERPTRFSRRSRTESTPPIAPTTPAGTPPPPPTTPNVTPPPAANGGAVPAPAPRPLTSIPSVPRLPAEQRKYFLSFQGATWEEVLNTFCRLSGLTIIGQYPRGPTGGITYINPRELTYYEAMHELNVLLTELGPGYWMAREKDDHLVLRRMSDWYRYVPQANQFDKAEDFQKAKVSDDDWVTVFYTPPKDQVLGDLIVNIQQTMPDNVVRAAPMGETNRLKITGIAFYVRQFLKMAENPIFQSETYDAQKQRQVKFYKIEKANATSVEAVIRNLVLPMGRPRIGTQTEQAEQVDMVLEPMSNTLIVKANAKWHREIETIIRQIEESEVTGEATPTFIELKNARAEELAMLLNPLLQAQSSMRPTWKRGEIDRERVYIQPEPVTNSLIVLATKEGMKRVEPLVKQLDTASPETSYKRVVLENARADQVFNLVNTIVQSRQMAPGRRGPTRPLQIVPDSQGNAIFVMGNPKDIEYAEKIIKELDTADAQRASAHVVKLKKARPTVVMQGLDALFGSGAAMRRGGPAGALRMIPDENSQILVVVCNDKDWKEIDPAIKQFDSEVVSLDPINKTISIKDGDAEELAQTLNNIFRGRLGRSPVTISADRKTNMLFVTALESAFEEIESLVQKLDVPSKEGQLEILPLENAQATEVAALIQQMFADRGGRFARGGAAGPQIIPDPIANALIVRASKSDFEEIEIQAARLDDAAKVVGIKPVIIQLEYADPMQVASLCEVLFIRGGSRARQMDRTTFFQPHRSGLIVRAPAQQMKEIQDFIKSLDSPEVENVEVKTVQVPGQDVNQLASTLERVFSAERSRRGAGVMSFMPNPGADMLIITAPKKRFEEIDKVIKQYTEGVKVSTANMKMFDLKNARVDEVGELLQQMLAAAVSRGGRSAAFRQVQIMREPRQNKLILFAPDDVMKQAEEMIKQLDVPLDKDAGGVQWIAMENTDASYVASTLNSMWSQRATSGRRSFRSLPVQIWPEPITNSVLIIAPADEYKEIEAFAKKLDAQAKIATTQPTIIKLEYAEPRYVVQMCEEMFLSQTASRLPGRRTAPGGDSISFNAMKSGIMVRAPQTRMKPIEEFIKTLDQPETSRMTVKTHHLPGLNVEQLYQTLQTVFGSMQLKRDEPRISFILDAPRESIIVSADSSRMAEIEKLITEFKEANKTEPGIQEMVPVTHTRASYAASQLDTMLRQQLKSRSKRLADQLQISPEDRQNKVIIYAPKDVLELAKTILKEIDVPVGPTTTQEIGTDLAIVKWIPMEHVDAATAAGTVKQIWDASLPPQRTNENRRPIQIWGESITNSVLVAGAYGKDFQEIERIVKDIDAKAVANPNKPVLIKLEYASPSEVASMLQAMFVPIGRRGQEKVMIQVVSTGIIVRAPKIEMDQIQEFIKGYDVAESTGLKIRSFYLPNTNVSELSSTLSTIFTYKKRKANEPGWSFVPNTAADTLMVLAPEARFKEIEDVIKQYTDNVQKTESKMHLIDVKHVRASEVYGVLSNLLIEKIRRSFGQRAASQIQMSYEPRQNKLVVFAPDEVMKQVEEMVQQIDVELKDDSEDIKWIPIEFADASEVASTVQSFFSRKHSGSKQRQNLEFRDVQIWPEMVTNSLLVSAPKKEYDEIEKLARKIDGEYAEKGLERVKITPKYVSAGQVQSMITQLFTTGRRRDVSAQMKQQIKVIPAGAYSFFLEAPKDKLPAIQKLIAEMDTEGENTPIIKTYKMGNANVAEIARALSTVMQGIGSYIPEPRRGALIVSAPKQHFEKIEKTMEELKAEIKEEEKQFEVIRLKYARPSSVYGTLSQLVSLQLSERRSRSGRSLELSLVPDDNNNRLFVHAAAEEMALVKKMLEQLDVENLRKEAELHTIPLKRTDCTYMYSKILQVFTPAEQQRRAAKRDQASRDVIPIQVVPEPTTNALLITCTEEDFRDIELFVAQMEDAFVEKEKVRELITPKFVGYSQLMATINAIYNPPAKSGTRRKEVEDIRAIPATGSSFFLECPKDKLADIKKLIDTLDVEDRNQPVVRTYKLGDMDLSALTRMLQTTLSGKGTFMTDPQLGMLIVSAPEHRFEQIEKTINQLKADIEETKQQFEVIALKYARPSSVYGTVTSLVSTQLSQRRGRRGQGVQLYVYPDDSNNRLFVYAAPEEMALVKKMLEQLDVENLRKEAELHTITLKRTDCTYMYSKITQVFTQSEQQRRAVKRGAAARDIIPIQVVPEPTTNTLLITCTEEDFRDIELFVAQMEDAFVEKEKVRELITPKFVGYSQLMATINAIYNPPAKSGTRRKEVEDVRAIPATGSSFYLEAPKDKLPELKRLIADLDVEDRNQPIVRTYKLGDAVNVSTLSRMLQTTMSGKGTFYPDPQLGMIIISAPEHRFEQIEKTMQQLKADIEETRQHFKVFPLKFAKANSIYGQLSSLVQTQAASSRSRRGMGVLFSIIPDAVLNRLFVYAGDEEMKLVEEMLKQFDIEGIEPETQVYPIELANADCSYVSSMVQQMFTQQELERRRRGQAGAVVQPIRIVPDPMSNRLLVWASPQDFKDIEKFVKEIDQQAADTKPERRIVSPKFIRVNELYGLIQNLFLSQRVRTGQRVRPIETVMSISGADLILNGPKDRIDEIEAFVKTVDTEERAKMEIKTFSLPDVDLSNLVSTLQSLYSQDARQQRGSMLFLPDPVNGELMVSAPKAMMKDIEEVINQKIEGAKKHTRKLTIFEIKHAEAGYMASMLTPLVTERTRMSRGRYTQPQVTITAESRTNRLFVMAGEAETKIAEELVKELDTEAMGLKDQIRVIEMKKAEATYVAGTLQAMAAGRAQMRKTRTYTATPIYIVAEPMTNRIFVAASEQDYKEIEQLAKEMDEAAELQGLQKEKIEVKYAQPQTLVSTITTMFQPMKSQRRVESDIRLTVAGANTIIAQAPASKMVEIKQWIKELDVQDMAESQTKFFPLEIARAAEVVGIVQPMLTAKSQEITMREGLRAQRSVGLMVIPDTRNNRVIVSGPSQILVMAEQLIKELDVEDPAWTGETVEIVEVEKAEATQVAQVLQQILTGPEGQKALRPRTGAVGQVSSLAVTIVPDPTSNTLVLKGLPRDLERVRDLIAQIEEKAVIGGTQIKLYRLKESDAEEVAKVVTTMVNQTADPRSKRNPIQVTSDYMMNAVFVAGTTKQQAMVQKIIDMYEKPEMEIDPNTGEMKEVDRRPFEFIQLVYSDAYDISYEIENILEKRYGTKKGPTIETMYGDSSTLMVYGKPDEIKAVRELVEMFEKKNMSKPPVTKLIELKDVSGEMLKRQLSDWGQLKPGDTAEVVGGGRREELVPEITIEQAEELRKKAEQERIEHEIRRIEGKASTPEEESKKPDVRIKRFGKRATTQQVSQVSRFVAPSILVSLAAELNGIPCAVAATPVTTTQAATAPAPKPVAAPRAQLPIPPAAVTKPRTDAAASPAAPKPKTARAAEVPTAVAQPHSMPAAKAKESASKVTAPPAESKSPVAKEAVTKSPESTPSRRTVAEEQPAPPANRFGGGASARESRRTTTEPVRDVGTAPELKIIVDEKSGVITLTGPERRVREMEDLIGRIQDEATTTIEKDVEYRVFKPRYLDVSVAAALLDRVFNEPRIPVPQPQQPQQPGAPAAKAGAKKEEQEKPEREERTSLRDYLRGGRTTTAGRGRIRCIPDLRTGYLIVVASPETQKEVKELLAKVDVPAPEAGQLRYYFLDDLDAREVEQNLKLILKMEGRARPQVPAAAAGQAAQNAALQQLQQQMQALQTAEGDITLKATESVTITSNTSTNTLIVMAPEKILKLIDDYIETLEEEASKNDLKSIPLDSADATVVAQTMSQIYGRRRGVGAEAAAAGVTVSQGGGSRVTITAESSTNTLFIRAPEPLLSEIITHVKELDQEAMREGKPTKLVLQKADPEVLAPKLQQVFAGRGKRRGKTDALQIIGDNASNTLIIRAPETIRREIEELAKAMDVEGTDTEIKIFELKHANAAEMHQQITQMTQQVVQQLRQKGQKSMEMDVFAAVPDPRTNTLIVTGGPKTFHIVEKILAQIDVPPTPSTEKVTVVYQLEQAQAADVARSITQLYQGKRGERYLKGGLEPPTAEFDPVTNTVIIRATEVQQNQIKREIIDRLEEFSKSKKVKDTTIELKYAKSDETAQMLNEFFTQRAAGRQRLQQRTTPNDIVTIVSEPNTNALLVRCNDENLEIIKRLVGQLDQAEVSGKAARKIKVFPFEYADPSYVAQAVRQSFQPAAGVRVGLRDRVDATPEYTTGSLIVVASEENMKLVEQMIKEVDQEGPSSRQMHVVEIKNGEPADIALALNQMFVQGRQTKRGGQPAVTIVNPQGTNKIMVMAHEADFKKISDAIKEMDSVTGAVAVRIVRLTHITPEEAQTVLQEFLRKPGRTGKWDTTLLGDVRISISDSVGGLVITAREEKLDELEKLIKKIDVEAPDGAAGTRKIEIFALEYANPYVAAQAITQTFAPRRGGLQSESERVVATADPTIGTVIVSASEKNLVKIRKLIEDLDKENKAGREVRVVTLKKARAQDVAQTLTAAYRSRMRTQRGDEPVSVTAEPDTNSLIIAAKRSEYMEIEELIKQLDIDPTSNEVMKVIPLDYIDAAEALTIMQDYLRRSGAAGGRGGTDLAGGTRVSASDSMNALVLSGKQENIAKLEQVVRDLDAPTAQTDRAPKIITLKAGQAGIVASLLSQIFTDPARQTAGRRRAGTAQEMVPIIMADESTNSLIVRARKTDFAMIEDMAMKLDRADLGTGAKIIPLPPTIDAAELSATIERTINEGERNRAAQTGKRPSLVAVAYDDRTNCLIVSGASEQFAQVERLVKDLQMVKPAGEPTMRVIKLKRLQASEIRQVLDQMMEQQGSRRRSRGY